MFRLSDDDIVKLKARNIEAFRYLDQEGKNEPDENKQKEYNRIMEIIKRIK